MDGAEDTGAVAETAAPEATETATPEPERGVARDEHGRFAPRQAEAPEAQRQPEAPKQDVRQALQQAPTPPQGPLEMRPPPKSWRKEYHEHWTKLDPALQDYTLQREEEYYRGIGNYKQQAEQWSQFMEAARPYEATFRAANLNPVQAFQALANADHVLRTADPATKAQMLARLAQTYGVDLGHVQNPPEVDPQMQQLHGTVQELQNRLLQQQQMFDELQRSFLAPQIEQMAAKPYFEELRPTMAQLLSTGFAASLNEAYDKALRMSPYFETTMAQQRQDSERARLQEAAQAAAKAKAAAVQVKGSPSTVLPDAKRDLRSQIESAFDEHLR